MKERWIAGAMSLILAGCAHDEPVAETAATEFRSTEGVSRGGVKKRRGAQSAFIDRYLEIYKNKNVDAMLALYDEDIMGVLYPTTLFGRGIEAARPGLEGDFEGRPNAYAKLPNRYRISLDKWMAFGQSINPGDGGVEERAPLWILFDLNDAGDKIEATYTQIGWRGMIKGAAVDEPTPAMTKATDAFLEDLAERDFSDAARHFAEKAALYSYPPASLENHGPVITGAKDVTSVLAFKWGEGAWRDDNEVFRYMQFVFVGIPAASGEERTLDRVALFTFDADPASPSFEKIMRVDVMGPSGG